MQRRGLIKDYIPGEEFGPLDGVTRKLTDQDKSISRDADFGRMNHGMKKHGYGLHHVSFEVGNKRDTIVNEMAEDGFEMRTIGIYPGSSWTVMDTEETLGVNVSIKPVR